MIKVLIADDQELIRQSLQIVLSIKDAVDGDILIHYIRGQLVLQAVYVNEDAVQFFLVGFEL